MEGCATGGGAVIGSATVDGVILGAVILVGAILGGAVGSTSIFRKCTERSTDARRVMWSTDVWRRPTTGRRVHRRAALE